MKYALGPEGLKALKSFCEKKCLLAFDFDGTLADLTRRPGRARMGKKTKRLLTSLKKSVPVAILSGRERRDLISVLKWKADYTVGNHGIEGVKALGKRKKLSRKISRKWVKSLRDQMPEGTWLEDKSYSLAVHYRESRHKERSFRELKALCQKLSPRPQIILGKDVLNIVPKGNPNKARALLAILRAEHMKKAIYVGDDHNDREVFALSPKKVFSVVVEKRPEFGAKYFVRSQGEVPRLIEEIHRLIVL